MSPATRFLIVLFAIVSSVPAFAGVVDDAIALANKGISDDVIVAWAEGNGGEPIGVNDILRMKEAKVPDRAVATIIRGQHRAQAPAAAAPAETVRNEAPAERAETCYVERPSVRYAAPAVYAAPVAYYSDYYYSSPYYSSYCYPYRGYGLSLSFGGYYGGSRYCGSSGHGYYGSHYGSHYGSGYYGSGHYGSHSGSGHYGSHYSGGNYGSHYGSGNYGSNYGSGYHGGSGYTSFGGSGFSSSFRRR